MREMKNSGVEWIGSMPATWQTLTVGSLFKLRNEKVNDTDYPPLSVSKGGIVPQMENVAKTDANDNRKMVLANDFVINSRSDRKQSCGVSPLDGSVSLINTVLYPAKGAPVATNYLNYLLKNYGFAEEFYRWGHGIVADLWTTRWQEMKSILLPVPTVEEQQKIFETISVETDKVNVLIANVQAQIEKLKAYKQSLITEVVTKGLDPTVPMKDSGVEWAPHIPDDWSVLPIGRVMYEKKERTKTGIETPLSVTQAHGIILAENANASNPTSSYIDWRCVEPEDIVFNKYKAHSGVFFVSPLAGIVTFNYSVYKCYEGFVPKYFEYQFKTLGCISEFRMSMRGVGESISPLYTRELFRIFVLCPPKNVQNQIVNYLNNKIVQIDRLIAIKQAKIEKLEQYKRSLIYEYVTGKKEVS